MAKEEYVIWKNQKPSTTLFPFTSVGVKRLLVPLGMCGNSVTD